MGERVEPSALVGDGHEVRHRLARCVAALRRMVDGGWFDEPAALADAIDRPSTWPGIRATALDHVRRNHDWSRNAQRYQLVYQTLLGRNAMTSVAFAA